MRLNRMILENVRSHILSGIDLNNGITVFTGRTGSGKSSILMALEYALFGTESGTSNTALMRRGVTSCKIELEFEEDGSIYKIIRGLKRSGGNISVDVNNMKIIKNGSPLPLIGRSTDLNEKILEILGYPDDVKPKELFEITSYTKQDEIRAIIELTAEKRQDYIDKILQLAKYKQTWENMKEIIDFFDMQLKEKHVRIESYEKLRADLLNIEKRVVELGENINKNNQVLSSARESYPSLQKKVVELETKYRGLLEKRRNYDQIKGSEIRLKRDIERTKQELQEFSKKEFELKSEIAQLGNIPELEELQTKNIGLLKTEEMQEKELLKNKSEFEKIKKLGHGKCPTCKQNISEKHIHDIEKEFSKLEEKIRKDLEITKNEQKDIAPLIINSRKQKLLKEQLERNKASLSDKESVIKGLEKELKDILPKIKEPLIENLPETEKELDFFKKQENELVSKMQSTTRENIILTSELNERKIEFAKRGSELVELEQNKSEIQNLEHTIQILTRMREDIRNIREVIRNNFLEDFRQEFQKKFEEIRKYEDEYSVDIKNDYEPVAFTSNGEEVPIANLSGGEKTSVALAYRLALANLAAQVSAIKPSEVLILDEPTTGFDQDDIKALPETLRNIQTIPQIIIVTHEEELKNAADYRFDVKKSAGKSTISPV